MKNESLRAVRWFTLLLCCACREAPTESSASRTEAEPEACIPAQEGPGACGSAPGEEMPVLETPPMPSSAGPTQSEESPRPVVEPSPDPGPLPGPQPMPLPSVSPVPASGGANGGPPIPDAGQPETPRDAAAPLTEASTDAAPPPFEPECASDEDCVLVDDCCECSVGPLGETSQCPADCDTSKCAARNVTQTNVLCRAGRCVLNLFCGDTQVSCDESEPVCPEGTVSSRLGSCWGPCLSPEDCGYVDDCADCKNGEVCVRQSVTFGENRSCIPVASDCGEQSVGECIGMPQCTPQDGGLYCPCGGC